MVEALINKLLELYNKDISSSFPYTDCRKLYKESVIDTTGLIPDLDLYFSEIAGYCSWGKRVLKWPKGKLMEVHEKLKEDFFSKNPKYISLKIYINEVNTPNLYQDMLLHEEMRITLLKLLSILLSEYSDN